MSVVRGIVHNSTFASSELSLDRLVAFERSYRTKDGRSRVIAGLARLHQNTIPVPKFVALVANPIKNGFYAIPVADFIEDIGIADKLSVEYADAIRTAKFSNIYSVMANSPSVLIEFTPLNLTPKAVKRESAPGNRYSDMLQIEATAKDQKKQRTYVWHARWQRHAKFVWHARWRGWGNGFR